MTEKGGKVRLSVSFPEEIYGRLEQIAKRQHRPIGSVVVEACDLFIYEIPVKEATQIAEQSPEYKAALKRLRKDLGLPPDPLQ